MSKSTVILFGTLLTLGLMWPSEGAILGDGLYLVILWLGLLAFAIGTGIVQEIFRSLRECVQARVAVVGMLLILAGFWVSTNQVFRSSGDRRSALNLSFEWTALTAAWLMVWVISRTRDGYRQMVVLIIALGVGTAVLGICQHHIMYPEQIQWYQSARQQLDSGTGNSDTRSSLEGVAIRAEFDRMNIPTAGPGRDLFERRLLSSSEPVGPFALANSLGGMLAATLVVLISLLVENTRERNLRSTVSWLAAAAAVVIVAYCLVLTKSRTAAVGCLTGVVSLFLLGRKHTRKPRTGRVVLIGTGLAAVVIGAAMATGAMDRQVLSEAPRSLQYRLWYWTGTIEVIRDNPLFGAGPGNFRQAYLAYKRPESSEEILDPHNIVLDAWATAGLPGLAGLLLCVGIVVWPSDKAQGVPDRLTSRPRPLSARLSAVSLLLAALLHWFWYWFTGGDAGSGTASGWLQWQNGVWLVPVVAVISAPVLLRFPPVSRHGARAAFIALLVHFCGAGGLQISGIMLIFLTLQALSLGGEFWGSKPAQFDRSEPPERSRWQWVLFGVIAAVAVSAARYGLIPVMRGQQQLALSALWKARGDLSAAIRSSEQAIQADPIAVECCQRNTELLTYEFLRRTSRLDAVGGISQDDFLMLRNQYQSLSDSAERLIQADRRGWIAYYWRSQAAARLGALTTEDGGWQWWQQAVGDLHSATNRYPTNSTLWVAMAEASDGNGNPEMSAEAASRALQQDQINHRWGHVDRYLDDEVAARMRFLCGVSQ